MMSPVGLTSRWVAASRARESETPQPLFDDPYARALAGEEGFALLSRAQQAGPWKTDGPNPYLSIRTRFFDDALLRAVEEEGYRQVVLLAAGMDARAFRLGWPEGLTLFEVDRQEIFDVKEPILQRLGARQTCPRKVVAADLADDWKRPLVAAGFDPEQPAAFLLEGLLVYLPESSVEALLEALRPVACRGSWLGLDVSGTAFLTSEHFKPLLELLDQLGCPWQFGTEEPEQLLARHGWSSTAVIVGEPAANFGRWPYPAAPRTVSGAPRNFLVTGRREG
jgi:methyltransferase (TIGR00027 family)